MKNKSTKKYILLICIILGCMYFARVIYINKTDQTRVKLNDIYCKIGQTIVVDNHKLKLIDAKILPTEEAKSKGMIDEKIENRFNAIEFTIEDKNNFITNDNVLYFNLCHDGARVPIQIDPFEKFSADENGIIKLRYIISKTFKKEGKYLMGSDQMFIVRRDEKPKKQTKTINRPVFYFEIK